MRSLSIRVVLLLAAIANAFGAGENPQSLEYRVKAAFLYNFARFVTWPGAAERQQGDLVIGILGKDPFGGLLERTVAGKTVAGKPFRVRRLKTAADAADCHLLFVSASERGNVDNVLASVRGDPVLTVGESEGFAVQGGMIEFVIEDEAVRIDMNLDAAREAGLEVSSQLLRVARTVRQSKR